LIKLSYYEITAHSEEERKSRYLILASLKEKKRKWREGGGENEGGKGGRCLLMIMR